MVLIGVDVGPGESVDTIGGWAGRVGLTWPLAPASDAPLRDYRVARQSTAVGIDATGEIVLRKNGGLQSEGGWREWLDTLAGPTASAETAAPATAAAVPAAPAPVEAVPTTPPAPTAPTTAPAQPGPTAVPTVPTAALPTAVPAPTATPRPAPTATPPPRPTATPVPTATPNVPVGHNVGQRAPDFTVTAVDGSTYTLSEVTASGKAVLVYFFATW